MTLTVGYAAMLEQLPPGEAVALAAHAEANGFRGTMASDHMQPWVPDQGQSAFVWNVLAAMGERTTTSFGPAVVAPGYRWHPVLVAQAAATLAAMYPGRAWLGLGAGEALNEHVVGGYWPEVGERSARLFEAVDLIRRLFDASLTGKDTKFDGRYHRHETMRLWTMPPTAPPIYVATAGPLNARRTGRQADGIITVGAAPSKLASLLTSFGEGAREAGKDPDSMPRILQVHLSWAASDDEAWDNALRHWPNGGMAFPKGDIRSPHDLAAMARLVGRESFANRMIVSSDPDTHRAGIQRLLDEGFNQVYLHNVGPNQREWISVFGEHVIPQLHL